MQAGVELVAVQEQQLVVLLAAVVEEARLGQSLHSTRMVSQWMMASCVTWSHQKAKPFSRTLMMGTRLAASEEEHSSHMPLM